MDEKQYEKLLARRKKFLDDIIQYKKEYIETQSILELAFLPLVACLIPAFILILANNQYEVLIFRDIAFLLCIIGMGCYLAVIGWVSNRWHVLTKHKKF